MSIKDGPQFGTLYANGTDAWVTFEPSGADNSKTVISDYDPFTFDLWLECTLAGIPGEKNENNRYEIDLGNGKTLTFGYAEDEPQHQKATIEKTGVVTGSMITWTIQYTPWQNPSASDSVTAETHFELRDMLDSDWNNTEYHDDWITIDGSSAFIYSSRDSIPSDAEFYVLWETDETGNEELIFGGTKLMAGKATPGTPAQPLVITYKTKLKDEWILPTDDTNKKQVSNTAVLYDDAQGDYRLSDIKGTGTVEVEPLTWLTKEGVTTRSDDGNGAVIDWTVTFDPNGLNFTEDNKLTFHDLMEGPAALVEKSVKVDGTSVTKQTCDPKDCTFSISPIVTNKTIEIKYQTHVPEEVYETGQTLGTNTAWFTFEYGGKGYGTSPTKQPVWSGNGESASTVQIEKRAGTYNAKNRTIDWTVTINPHKADFKSGTFTDDLSAVTGGPACNHHTKGLELVGNAEDIEIKIDNSLMSETNLAELTYDEDTRVLTASVGAIGKHTLQFTYTTKVCDPCIFANNTKECKLCNTISTDNMVIGSREPCAASAPATADVSATVLTKKEPVYDYEHQTMKWEIEVNAAGLPMTGVELKDALPKGLAYKEGTLRVGAVSVTPTTSGQDLTTSLGDLSETKTVTFETTVDRKELGFDTKQTVDVENTIQMTGLADGLEFDTVSSTARRSFQNHGLVKKGNANVNDGLISYSVLINPYILKLPQPSTIIDQLGKGLQLDMSTLRLQPVKLSGTTDDANEEPSYVKTGAEQQLSCDSYDPATNTFKVRLPIMNDSSAEVAYLLTYAADIVQTGLGDYTNNVHFEGVGMTLGGEKDCSVSVGGGGGGGAAAGLAARKATIKIEKTKAGTDDQTTGHEPLSGVTFTLYLYDTVKKCRGLIQAQGKTDSSGELSFFVNANTEYELVETPLKGYQSTFGYLEQPDAKYQVKRISDGIHFTSGAKKDEMTLKLTNTPVSGGTGNGGGNSGGGSSGGGGGFGGGSGDSGLPNIPDDSGKIDDSDEKDDVDDPDKKDDEKNPEDTEDAEDTDKSEKPEKPNKPSKPSKPTKPNKTNKPSNTNKPSGKTDQTGQSSSSGKGGQSGKTKTSSQSGSSAKNGVYDQTSTSGKTGFSGQTSAANPSGASDGTGASAQQPADPDIPQTGDNTPWLAAIVLLSGILLVAMSCYQLFRLKKREKR